MLMRCCVVNCKRQSLTVQQVMIKKGMKMKKILLTGFVVTTLCVSTFADQGNLFGVQIGYSSNQVTTSSTKEEKGAGVYINYDFLGMNNSRSGFGFGMGFDINAWNPANTSGISDGQSMYTMGGTVKLGYTFEEQYNVPLKLKGGVGYGLLDVGVHNAWGLQYEGSMEYAFYKGTAIGVKYKHAQATMLNNDISIDSTIAFISFGPGK